MRKKLFTFLLALVTSVGMSWATTTDLASITGNYTAQDGEILTGTLGVSVQISIADGATVTLLNANINGDKTLTTGDYAGLTCLGDATITIVGKNSVSGFSTENGYPGIYVPSGKTLIINGTGSLTAQSSTEDAAGIGARKNTHCGNIEIQSGKITAIAGGEEGAGIGGGFNADCGNITISGGIVTAIGGYRSAGIGGGRRSSSTNAGHCGNILISGGVVSATSGEDAAAIGGGRGNNVNYKSNCGTITITNTALKVYADQGGNANTIGAGKQGNCGKVTIGGIEGVINNDPYTYRTKEDEEIVVDYINAIGTVVYTQECKDKIDIARELYDALEDSQIDLVTNYQTLLDAEAAYAALIPAPTPSVNAARFVYNYDCQRSPAYPQAGSPCKLSGFGNPYVGYKGIGSGVGNKALGPWKLEFVGYYTPSNHYECEYRVISAVNSYYPTLSDEEKEAKCLEVPIFRLWQYNLEANEYQHASYGIICAYAAEANAQDHGALFISSASWGCFLTGHQHTSSFNISCENDLTTGMADLVAAASINDPDLDAVQPIIVSIDAIGTVELSEHCKYYIEGSRAAYNALTDEQKAQVTNYSTLTDAETQWADLVAAAQPYADEVIDLINAIPDPVVYTQDCKDKIDAAQAAYDALTDGQKILVSNYETLKNAPSDLIKAAPYVHILFKANGNEKKVENVTFPKEFTEAEMTTILKELYGVEGDYNMYANSNSNADAVNIIPYEKWTISPFMGKVNVNGGLYKYDPQTGFDQIDFGLEVSLELPPFGSAPAPTPTDEQVPTNEDPENPSYHYSTFFHSTQNYKLTNDGTQAFIADLSGSDLVLTKIAEGTQVIPANTAVILRKSGSADPVVLTPTEENGVSFSAHNSLEGVDDATAITSIDGLTATNCYVLSGTNEYGVGFYRINSENLKAHKAYVKYAGLQNNAPKRMRFVFNTTTDVEAVTGYGLPVTEKRIENGQLIIIRDGVRYNAQGQIVK